LYEDKSVKLTQNNEMYIVGAGLLVAGGLSVSFALPTSATLILSILGGLSSYTFNAMYEKLNEVMDSTSETMKSIQNFIKTEKENIEKLKNEVKSLKSEVEKKVDKVAEGLEQRFSSIQLDLEDTLDNMNALAEAAVGASSQAPAILSKKRSERIERRKEAAKEKEAETLTLKKSLEDARPNTDSLDASSQTPFVSSEGERVRFPRLTHPIVVNNTKKTVYDKSRSTLGAGVGQNPNDKKKRP
jgi:septal ring factor EnvC (AmiA/AmiB activator)